MLIVLAGSAARATAPRAPPISPLATILAEHTTPELVYLQARFAAVMSYAQAGALLGEVLPLGRRLHPSGVRAQLHQVATRLEAELGAEDTAGVGGCPRDWGRTAPPRPATDRGLDGGYVHSCTQTSRKDGWFEVIAGKSMPTDGEAKCFAFVQKIETKPRRRLFEVLSAQGMAANQSITFLTDGGEDFRIRSPCCSRCCCGVRGVRGGGVAVVLGPCRAGRWVG